MKLFAAPLQGYTEAPFRHYHAKVYGGCNGAADVYYTPFVRIEHDEVRQRDLRDTVSPLNINHRAIPQIIVKDRAEFERLTDALAENGHRSIDINMGCPFPPQVRKGRGAAIVARHDVLADIAPAMQERDTLRFSIKMRLGVEDATEWRQSIDVINSMPLTHVTVHPRVARQQYGGDLHIGEFAELTRLIVHPVVFNGDITTPEGIDITASRFPNLLAIMAGRGLLARPSLIAEWRDGRTWTHEERLEHILALHSGIRQHYETTLCGESQTLAKLKPFWEYLEEEIGRKNWKAIRKATTLARYADAVSSLQL